MDEELIRAIEQLNKEHIDYLNSSEIRKLNRKKLVKNLIKKHKFRRLLKTLKRKKEKFHALEGINLDYEMKEIKDIENAKVAIYTCMLGGYEKVRDPLFKMKNSDYFFFTDNFENTDVTIWNKVEIPNEIKKLEDNVLINRYLKFHPHEIFKEYDYTIYVDASIRIISETNSVIQKINPKTGLAMHTHNKRSNVYQEATACINAVRGNKDYIISQVKKYKEEGLPEDSGLFSAGIIATDLHNENSKKILELWWKEFEKSKSMRDQLALPYILWKNNFKYTDVGFLGNNIERNVKFRYYSHI